MAKNLWSPPPVLAAAVGCLLLLLSLAMPALASVRLLPAFGRVFLELEVVSTVSDVTKVRTATVTGDVRSSQPYPFYIERMYSDALVRTLVESSTKMCISTDQGEFTEQTSDIESNDNVLFWKFLRTLLTDVYESSTIQGEEIHFRGVPTLTSVADAATLTLPVSFGGTGKTTSYSVEFLTNSEGVSLNFQNNIRNSPLTVNLYAASEETVTITFSYYGTNVTSDEDLSASSGCGKVAAKAMGRRAAVHPLANAAKLPPRARGKSASARQLGSTASRVATVSAVHSDVRSTSQDLPMPPLPDEFSANFQVISPLQKAVYFMRNSFSAYDLNCYTTLQGVYPDAVGRVSSYEWYVRGQSQLTYYQVRKVVLDSTAVVNENIQEYFWPGKDTCERALIGYDILAASGAALLLVDKDVPPMFVGNRTVRNIPCGVWSAPVRGARVSWYFASVPSAFDDVYNASGTTEAIAPYGRLVRIAVEGFGTAAPFFLHHPFFAQPYAFPNSDRWAACWTLTPYASPRGCSGLSEDPFTFYYDVTSFVPYVPFSDNDIPDTCYGVHTGSAFPSAACRLQGVPAAGAAVVLVLVAIIFLFLGSCCMWCRFAPMVRGLQEDMIRLVDELRRRDENENTTADTDTGAGSDPAGSPVPQQQKSLSG